MGDSMSSTRPHFGSLQNLKFAGFSRRHERNNPASLLLPILQVEIPSSHATKTLFPAPEPEPTSPYLPRAAYWAAAMADDVLSPAIQPNAHGPEHVFRQYRGRRAGIVKALTEDVEEFYEQCDPDKKPLCLFGLPDGTWEVNQLPEEVPVQLPEPVCGINFARDVTPKKVWLSIVAVHSDAWLMSMAFYHAGRVSFDRDGREQLFKLINRLPTVYEAVKGSYERQTQTPNGSRKNRSSSQPPNQFTSNSKPVTPALPMLKQENYADFNSWTLTENCPTMLKEEGDGGKEGGGGEDQATKCAGCEEIYSLNDGHLWIGCDHCQRWFHGKCVRVTSEMAHQIGQYMCPSCSYKARMKPSDSK